jgi:hypothetical protein
MMAKWIAMKDGMRIGGVIVPKIAGTAGKMCGAAEKIGATVKRTSANLREIGGNTAGMPTMREAAADAATVVSRYGAPRPPALVELIIAAQKNRQSDHRAAGFYS